MKVVHLIGGGDIGGAKVHVLSLVKELGKHIEVKLISLRPGQFAEDARAMGIDVEVVKSGNILSDIKRVAGIIQAGGYHVVHSHGAKANLFSLATKRYIKVPRVTTVHSDYKLDYMHSKLKTLTIGSFNSIALRFMDYYVAVSDNFREMLVNRGFNPSDIYVLYNGIDFSVPKENYSREALIAKYRLNIKEDDVLVGIAARLYPVKSIDTLVRAAKSVCERNRKVKFLIGGDGEDKESLEKLVGELGISDQVFFLGWLEDRYEVMSIVDISVLTSISESFPYSILEGAVFSKATVSTRVGGIPKLITHGENGYLFEPKDHERMADLILELAADPEKRKRMGEKIHEKGESQFSMQHMCRTQLEIYEGIQRAHKGFSRRNRPYDVILSGYYGFQNIGDDALLMSIVNDLRKYKPDIRMVILSRNPLDTARLCNVDSIERTNILRIFRIMKRARTFLYGGGNIIQDNTSSRSLFFYLGTVWLAKRMNLKVMFYANGIGPLIKRINRTLTRKIMNQVDVITLREELSFHEMKELGVDKPKVFLTADAALSVLGESGDDSDATQLLKKLGIENRGPYIGFSLRKCPGHEKFQHEDYEEAVARLADYMSETHGLYPVFIPMHYPVDLPVLRNVAAGMRNKSYVVQSRLDVKDTYALIGKMEMLVGMRLHALVFGAAACVPMVGLVYEPKIEGFLNYIGQASAGDVREVRFEALKDIVEDVWNRREEIRGLLCRNVALLKDKAIENARIAVELISEGIERE